MKKPTKSDEGHKRASKPAHKAIHHVVPVDELRTRVGETPCALGIDSPEGVDELGEELGEEFVKNVTGADDAAMAERDDTTGEDEDGVDELDPEHPRLGQTPA